MGLGVGWGLHLPLTKCFGSKCQFKSLTYIISFIIVQFGILDCEKVLCEKLCHGISPIKLPAISSAVTPSSSESNAAAPCLWLSHCMCKQFMNAPPSGVRRIDIGYGIFFICFHALRSRLDRNPDIYP